MLREGWDVTNVTTIVPLRPYSSKAEILPGADVWDVDCAESHRRAARTKSSPSWTTRLSPASINRNWLRKGCPSRWSTSMRYRGQRCPSIPTRHAKTSRPLRFWCRAFPAGTGSCPRWTDITLEEVREAFKPYKPLPLAGAVKTEIDYEGRQLLTGEIVERMKIHIELLDSGIGAISYYRQQLEMICKVRGTHAAICAPFADLHRGDAV